ncbi:mariner Mos1 transposase [Nephila pilipes]|uniref:Mariner Mos1 transposase n=1 Tax=Nephila pilipes TaxID=299642 RepID=A0A8X6UNW6_NEPPI|nr:mariner Mos1 transposase [Nephila pilipes]
MYHPPHSPDLLPLDFHAFGSMNEVLLKRQYISDYEVKAATQEWLSGIGWNFFAEGIEKLVPRLEKCLNKEVIFNEDYPGTVRKSCFYAYVLELTTSLNALCMSSTVIKIQYS